MCRAGCLFLQLFKWNLFFPGSVWWFNQIKDTRTHAGAASSHQTRGHHICMFLRSPTSSVHAEPIYSGTNGGIAVVLIRAAGGFCVEDEHVHKSPGRCLWGLWVFVRQQRVNPTTQHSNHICSYSNGAKQELFGWVIFFLFFLQPSSNCHLLQNVFSNKSFHLEMSEMTEVIFSPPDKKNKIE